MKIYFVRWFNQGFFNHFPTPWPLSEGGRLELQGFGPQGGLELQVFGREAPENGAEGAVLENFYDFSKKLSLKNAIKSENLGVWGWKFFQKSDFGKYYRKVFRNVFFRQYYGLKLQ